MKIAIFRYNLLRIGSRMVGNVFTTFVFFPGFFPDQKVKYQIFWTWSFFQKMSFRQKLDFWVIYLERSLIKVVHMDRTDHLGFR